MRLRDLGLVAVGGALLLTGCDKEYDAAEQHNKSEILSTRDELTLRMAGASEASGDLADAERTYIQLSKNGSPQSTMELAGFYTRHNQAARAVEILQAAYIKSPDDMNLMRSLANALISAGNPEKALGMLDGALTKHNDLAYIYNSRGVALDKLSRYDEAQKSYLKAIALAPEDDVDFKTNLSMSYILAAHYNDAIKLLTPVVTAKRATPAVRQNLALAYGLKGNMEMAMKIGSKDLTIKEMNENIRFYALVTKQTGNHNANGPSYSSAEPDPFPAIASPPIPVSVPTDEMPTAQEAPPVTGITAPNAAAPAVAPITTSDAPPPPVAPSAATAVSTKPIAATPTETPVPTEPVRNLSQVPPVITPQVAAALSPQAAPIAEKIVRPQPELISARKSPAIQPSEASDDTATTTASETEPAIPASAGNIPVPVLKPDKW